MGLPQVYGSTADFCTIEQGFMGLLQVYGSTADFCTIEQGMPNPAIES